ncbi:MAG: hypothetical protein IPI67_22790 [Myxococcales bacterium]|nr:hypothetical protein [Myxococcales bacterium]
MSLRTCSFLPALLLVASSARAEEPAAPGAAEPNPPNLTLRVSERGPGLPWSLSISNRGQGPAVLAADPRLLSLEVQVPSKKKTETCRLPSDLFPGHADKRTLVLLEPGEGVEQRFDPRLYCFAAGGQWQLVPGAIVTPHFGFPEKKKTVWRRGKRTEETPKQDPPFAVMLPPKKGASRPSNEGGVKGLRAEPFALKSEYAEWSRTKLPADKKAIEDSPLEIKMVQGSDAQAERAATVRITVHNRSKHAETVYFRRELVSYEVMRPDGLVTCDPQPDERAPDRQAFTRLGPGGKISVVSRLIELCPTGTFGSPGLYLVHARYDATESGDDWNIDAFVGRVVSRSPATVRIRTGEQPFLQKRTLERVRVSRKPGIVPPR